MAPATTLEQYAEDGVLVLGGAAAILLQVADPVVAAGVARHSAFATDPLRRLRHTLTYVYAVTLGDDELTRIAAHAVDRRHEGVTGARDPDRQLWVAATLYRVGVDLHERLHGPLPEAVADEVYAASARLGTALQLPPGMWPVDRAAFDAYWDDALAGLRVGEDARSVARDVLHPRAAPLWARAAMPPVRIVTAELLDDRIRRAYGIPSAPRRARLLLAITRVASRIAPRRLRSLPSRRLLAGLRSARSR